MCYAILLQHICLPTVNWIDIIDMYMIDMVQLGAGWNNHKYDTIDIKSQEASEF